MSAIEARGALSRRGGVAAGEPYATERDGAVTATARAAAAAAAAAAELPSLTRGRFLELSIDGGAKATLLRFDHVGATVKEVALPIPGAPHHVARFAANVVNYKGNSNLLVLESLLHLKNSTAVPLRARMLDVDKLTGKVMNPTDSQKTELLLQPHTRNHVPLQFSHLRHLSLVPDTKVHGLDHDWSQTIHILDAVRTACHVLCQPSATNDPTEYDNKPLAVEARAGWHCVIVARRSKDPAAGAGVTTHTVNGIGIGGSAEPTQGMTRDGLAADLARVSVTVEILPPFVLCNRLPCAFEYILVCRESGAASEGKVEMRGGTVDWHGCAPDTPIELTVVMSGYQAPAHVVLPAAEPPSLEATSSSNAPPPTVLHDVADAAAKVGLIGSRNQQTLKFYDAAERPLVLRVEHEQKSGIGREAVVFASYWLLNKCEHFGDVEGDGVPLPLVYRRLVNGRGSRLVTRLVHGKKPIVKMKNREAANVEPSLRRGDSAPGGLGRLLESFSERETSGDASSPGVDHSRKPSVDVPGIFKNPFAGLSTALHGGSETEFAEEISSVAAPAGAREGGSAKASTPGEKKKRSKRRWEQEHAEHCRDTHAETAPVMLSYSANSGLIGDMISVRAHDGAGVATSSWSRYLAISSRAPQPFTLKATVASHREALARSASRSGAEPSVAAAADPAHAMLLELVATTVRAPPPFHRTRIVNVMPRLVLVNLSKFDIHVAQLDADQAKHPPLLLPRQKAQALADDAAHGGIVWHWPDSRFRRRLRLRVAGGDAADGWGGGGWEWSAPFPIGDEAAAAIDVFMLKSRRKPSFADGVGGGASPGRRSDAHTNSLSSEYSGGAERSWGRLIAVEEERLQGVTYVKFDEGLKHEELFHFKNEMEHTVYYRQEVRNSRAIPAQFGAILSQL